MYGRKLGKRTSINSTRLQLLLATHDLPGADIHVMRTGLVADLEIHKRSPERDVIHFSTPAWVAVENWQMPTAE